MTLVTVPLKKCDKPDCFRQTILIAAYCCSPCQIAAEGKYEIHEHTHTCNARDIARGEWVDPTLRS